jgi:hypothetical protein
MKSIHKFIGWVKKRPTNDKLTRHSDSHPGLQEANDSLPLSTLPPPPYDSTEQLSLSVIGNPFVTALPSALFPLQDSDVKSRCSQDKSQSLRSQNLAEIERRLAHVSRPGDAPTDSQSRSELTLNSLHDDFLPSSFSSTTSSLTISGHMHHTHTLRHSPSNATNNTSATTHITQSNCNHLLTPPTECLKKERRRSIIEKKILFYSISKVMNDRHTEEYQRYCQSPMRKLSRLLTGKRKKTFEEFFTKRYSVQNIIDEYFEIKKSLMQGA